MSKRWYDQDDFWIDMIPKLFTPDHWQNASSEVKKILKLIATESGASILDLCCGPGRHALELARKKYQVTAVDRTVHYLNQVREQARKERLSIEIIQEDMQRFERPHFFDGVINMYTSFGYFDDHQQNLQVLKHVHTSLKAGGRFLLDLVGKEILARVFSEQELIEKDGYKMLEERKISDNWSRIRNKWTLFDSKNKVSYSMSLWIYSAREIEMMLNEAGFKEIHIYGSLDGIPYDHNAERLVSVARK